GAAWVDENRKKTTGIYNLRVYAEGPLTVSEGPKKQAANKGWIDLGTRGEIRIKAYSSKVIQQALPNEPLYQKALYERAALLTPPVAPAVPAVSPRNPVTPVSATGMPGLPLQPVVPGFVAPPPPVHPLGTVP